MKNIDIHIEGKFGSKFQEQYWGNLLEQAITTIIREIIARHKNNKFTINGKEILYEA
ncbi:MAG: hypothetical protein KGI58_04030 [Patescibacteria group bacterium]|nr:hypothetical protein [Patescibacteria group bacterium]